jgi:hypothetical protein
MTSEPNRDWIKLYLETLIKMLSKIFPRIVVACDSCFRVIRLLLAKTSELKYSIGVFSVNDALAFIVRSAIGISAVDLLTANLYLVPSNIILTVAICVFTSKPNIECTISLLMLCGSLRNPQYLLASTYGGAR